MFRKAIKLNPNYPQFYNNLGVVLEKAHLFGQAAELFGWAIKLNPSYTEALNNFGTVLIRTNQLDQAETYFRQAIEGSPNYARAYNNLGLVLEKKNCRAEALKYFRRAVKLEPNDPVLYNNLGKILKDSRQLKEAEACFCHALKLRPNFVDADFALAILYLLQENYEKGWEKYDDLRLLKDRTRHFAIPHWRGEELTGRKILLYADQGFGDTIHFVRYARKVARLASEVSLLVQKPLERLLSFSLTNCQIYNDDMTTTKEYDFVCPLLSLPHIFHTSKENISCEIPYLQPNTACVKAWSEVFNRMENGMHRYRIGVVWAGNSAHHNDRNRSIPFDIFASLLDSTHVNWISLQVGKRADDLAGTRYHVIDLSKDLMDFSETAGVIANLDLVITVDSAVAHLAGALGQKTWLLLPFNPDWRWQLDREDSPWYPTLRLFRQHEMDTWPEVLAEVKKSLMEILE
jgi:cytochrome c-type biogenesis protein CcmH/NrfG